MNIIEPQLLGKRLQELLKIHGLTQEQFAEEFCTSSRNVRRWIQKGINKLNLIREIIEFLEPTQKTSFLIRVSFFRTFLVLQDTFDI